MQASPLPYQLRQLQELAGTPLVFPTDDQLGTSTPSPSQWFTPPSTASHYRHNPNSPITPSISPLTPFYESPVIPYSPPSPGPVRFTSARCILGLWRPGRQRFLDPADEPFRSIQKSVELEGDPLVAIEIAAAQSKKCVCRLMSDLIRSEDEGREKDEQSKFFFGFLIPQPLLCLQLHRPRSYNNCLTNIPPSLLLTVANLQGQVQDLESQLEFMRARELPPPLFFFPLLSFLPFYRLTQLTLLVEATQIQCNMDLHDRVVAAEAQAAQAAPALAAPAPAPAPAATRRVRRRTSAPAPAPAPAAARRARRRASAAAPASVERSQPARKAKTGRGYRV